MKKKIIPIILVPVLALSFLTGTLLAVQPVTAETTDTVDDYVFVHHSCGSNWLSSGLRDALDTKDYIDEVNDVTYGTTMPQDSGRPDSLGSVEGDHTDMNHWIYWFNDYLDSLSDYGTDYGYNRIIMFKSCYPASYIYEDGTEPGIPWGSKTLANYKAVFRHPDGTGNVYSNSNGYTYQALEDVFAAHPEILFIPITAPPMSYFSGTPQPEQIARARQFTNWLVDEWLPAYNARNPGLDNVAVYDWFDFLANPNDHAERPNFLQDDYGGLTSNSHPNTFANQESTKDFATDPGNFLDTAWDDFAQGAPDLSTSYKTASQSFVTTGSVLTYTVGIRNDDGPITQTVFMTDSLPYEVDYIPGSLTATIGTVSDIAAPMLEWQGLLDSSGAVTITYAVTVTAGNGAEINNIAGIHYAGGEPLLFSSTVRVRDQFWQIFLPLIRKDG